MNIEINATSIVITGEIIDDHDPVVVPACAKHAWVVTSISDGKAYVECPTCFSHGKAVLSRWIVTPERAHV